MQSRFIRSFHMFGSKPRSLWFASLLLVVAFALKIWTNAHLGERPVFSKYPALALAWVSGQDTGADRLGDLSPLYFWAHVALAGAGLDSAHTMCLLQILLSTVTALFVYALADSLYGRWAGLTAGILYLLYDMASVYATVNEPETAIVFLNTLALWLVARSPRNGSSRALLAAGLALGVSCMLRPTAIAAAFVLGLHAAVRTAPQSGTARWRAAASMLAPSAVALTAVLMFNGLLCGQWGIMNPGPVFYEGNNPDATGYHSAYPYLVSESAYAIDAPDAHHIAYRNLAAIALRRDVSVKQCNAYWTARAFQWARRYPYDFVKGLLVKLHLAIAPFEAHDDAQAEATSTLWRGLLRLRLRIIFPLAALGAVAGFRRGRSGFLISYVMVYLLVMVVFYVTTRHRLPIVAVYCVFAGSLADKKTWAGLGRRRLPKTLAALLMAGAALALSVQPPKAWFEDRAYWERTSAAVHASVQAKLASNRGDHEEACRQVLRSVAADPAAWRAYQVAYLPYRWNALMAAAETQLAAERAQDAARTFDLAQLQLANGNAEQSLRNLGDLSRRSYRPVRNYQPDSLAYYQALAHLTSGRAEASLDKLQEARKQDPGDLWILGQCFALAKIAGDEALARECAAELAGLHDPLSIDYSMGLGYLRAGDPKAALPLLESVAGRQPNLWVVHWALCRAFVQEGQLEQAVHRHEIMSRLRPDTGTRGTGINELARRLAPAGRDPRFVVRTAGMLAENGDPEAALALLNALAPDPAVDRVASRLNEIARLLEERGACRFP